MTEATTPLDPALVSKAHEARRHRPLPPLDDLLPLTEDEALPLDWSAPPIAGPRWHDLPMLADAAAGVLILAGLTYIALVLI